MADTDGDGLTDGDEVNVHGTDPLNADTDGDLLTDGEEVNVYGTDPLAVDDSDGDGVADGSEIKVHGTDRFDADTDGDLHSDGTEIAGGSDPTNPLSVPSAAGPVTVTDEPPAWELPVADDQEPLF